MRFFSLFLSWLTLPLVTLALKGDWECHSAVCVAAVVEDNIVHCERLYRGRGWLIEV